MTSASSGARLWCRSEKLPDARSSDLRLPSGQEAVKRTHLLPGGPRPAGKYGILVLCYRHQ